MENKTLLKLPETWHIVANIDNQSILQNFLGYELRLGAVYGRKRFENGELSTCWGNNIRNDFGQEITTEDFKRLVLGETMEKEVTIIKTWETIYFKTENATVELTLNHEKQTFDLQTASEEMVSFKKDTIEVARERVKCINSALDYAEKYLK